MVSILVNEKLQELSGSTMRDLFSLIRKIFLHVKQSRTNLDSARKLVFDLERRLDSLKGARLDCGRLWEEERAGLERFKEQLQRMFADDTDAGADTDAAGDKAGSEAAEGAATTPVTTRRKRQASAMAADLQLTDLPVELLFQIFARVASHHEIFRVGCIQNAIICSVIYEDQLWRDLCYAHFSREQVDFVRQNELSRRETRSIFSTGSSRRGSRPASIGPLQPRAPLIDSESAAGVFLTPASADNASASAGAPRVRAESERLHELVDLHQPDTDEPEPSHVMFQSGPNSAALSLNGTPFRQGSRSHRESPLREFSLTDDVSVTKSAYEFANSSSNGAGAGMSGCSSSSAQVKPPHPDSNPNPDPNADDHPASKQANKPPPQVQAQAQPLVAVGRDKVSSLVRAYEASAAAKILGVSDEMLTARMQRMQRQLERRRWYNIYRGLLRSVHYLFDFTTLRLLT